MENETVKEIINEIEIIQKDEKPIVEEVKPKEELKEKHVEAVQQIPVKTEKIVVLEEIRNFPTRFLTKDESGNLVYYKTFEVEVLATTNDAE